MLELATALGKRYERLLFLAAPIMLLTLFSWFVTATSVRQVEFQQAECFAKAAKVFSDKFSALEARWKGLPPEASNDEADKLQRSLGLISYGSELRIAWILGSDYGGCSQFVPAELDKFEERSPSDIVEHFTNRSLELRRSNLSAFGISLPTSAEIDLIVTRATVDLPSLATKLQAVLFPILLVWLGSLQGTRGRETLTIAQARGIQDIFPHVINQYPFYNPTTPRKREFLVAYSKQFACYAFATIRCLMVLLIIGPPVILYIHSFIVQWLENGPSVTSGVATIVVLIFVLANVATEFDGQHIWKIFDDPHRDPRYSA